MVARGRSLAAALMVSGLIIVVPTATGGGVAAEGATARAKTPRCTIVGTAKADRLVGTRRHDVICGRGGDDVIIGGGGDDVLVGGPGADTVEGRAGRDVISGGAGDDDLDGGPAVDEVDGGPGVNVCAVDAADEADRCAYDRLPPSASIESVSASSVDVTSTDQTVVVRVHAVDDTGVTSVAVRPGSDTPWFPLGRGKRIHGTADDGWYELSIPFLKWSIPGTYEPEVVTSDRLGRRTVQTFASQSFDVTNSDPDVDLPDVSLLSPAPGTVIDTRSRNQVVTVRARITDAKTGVDPERVSMALWSSDGSTGIAGGAVKLVSGDYHDGVWTVNMSMPRNSIAGAWSVGVNATDVANSGGDRTASWWGPIEYGRRSACGCWPGQELREFADGAGTVQVLGRTRTDHTPPTVSAATVSPSTVDTLATSATMQVTVDAQDAGSGVAGLNLYLIAPDSSEIRTFPNPVLTSGTTFAGTWTGQVKLPRGTPPGTYYLRVTAWDPEDNGASYGSSAAPWLGYPPLEGVTTVTVIEH